MSAERIECVPDYFVLTQQQLVCRESVSSVKVFVYATVLR